MVCLPVCHPGPGGHPWTLKGEAKQDETGDALWKLDQVGIEDHLFLEARREVEGRQGERRGEVVGLLATQDETEGHPVKQGEDRHQNKANRVQEKEREALRWQE